jgi:hypothetical protein
MVAQPRGVAAAGVRHAQLSYSSIALLAVFSFLRDAENRAMSTYESVLQETGRFEVVDARDKTATVLAYTECLYRVSISKRYPAVRGATSYRLLDGTPLRRSNKGFFDTLDGMKRFFVVQGVETPEAAC